jgi:hypothetical protein
MNTEPNPIRITEINSNSWLPQRFAEDCELGEYFSTDNSWHKFVIGEITAKGFFKSWQDALNALHSAEENDTLVEEYENMSDYDPKDPAKRILFAIFEDLNDRRAVKDGLEDVDDNIMEEILRTNLEIILKNMLP